MVADNRMKGPAVLVIYHNDYCVPGIASLGACCLSHVTLSILLFAVYVYWFKLETHTPVLF